MRENRSMGEGNEGDLDPFFDEDDVRDFHKLIEERRWWKGLFVRLKRILQWLLTIGLFAEATTKILDYLQKPPTGHP
jgi:hypothetical protein